MEPRPLIFPTMFTLLLSLRDCFRSRAVLQAEILAVRHQLLIFDRSSRSHNLRCRWTDRAQWVWLSRLWSDWRSAQLMVKPETVIAWHRRGFASIGAGKVGIATVARLYVK
jgi:hypothetical protein